ncbi:hypothetical protein [Bacillus sp. EB01]|uniref:hypothetical protein n=1 Tax=Bacillus sp. EB01 TaxID=1347086 RepID=UPI0005C663F7|nr:hypothetical protein [Bacillus sp. EB01]
MDTRGDKIDLDDLSFIGFLKIVKLRNITIKYPGTYIALLGSFLFYKYIINGKDFDSEKVTAYLGDTVVSVSASLLGIIIAALAILIALAMGEVAHLLLKNKTLQKLLFPFWLVTVFWGLSTFLSISIFFFQPIFNGFKYFYFLYSVEVFIFIYALYATIGLIGSSIKIMILVARLIPKSK